MQRGKICTWTTISNHINGLIYNSQQGTGHFRIIKAISKPRHVFVFIINTAVIEGQTKNTLLYNTFSVANARNLDRCYLEVGNGNEYPILTTNHPQIYQEFIEM